MAVKVSTLSCLDSSFRVSTIGFAANYAVFYFEGLLNTFTLWASEENIPSIYRTIAHTCVVF